jgi:16S rRNA (guanine1207-N2)-methyltransferase
MPLHALYGAPPAGLCTVPTGAEQFSPLVPGSRWLDELTQPLASLTMLAPPGTIERRYALALAIQKMGRSAKGVALAPKDKGGSRLAKELESFGCETEQDSKQHHKICPFSRPENPTNLDEAIREGAPRFDEALGMHTQPGIFSWDRVDPGSQLLLNQLPHFRGRGADLGCGMGILSRKVLESKDVRQLQLVDVDGRAVRAARKNVTDPRAVFHWADLRELSLPAGLDFVVTNPPFHDGGAEDRLLGLTFLRKSAELLREGGACWLVANRHLPYEETLDEFFSRALLKSEGNGFKVYEAIR